MMNEQCDLPCLSIFSDRQFLAVFSNKINDGDFRTFSHCRRSAGDNIELLESPTECGNSTTMCYVMLSYVMLCYAMLCYVMLCYAILCDYSKRCFWKII